MIARQAPITFYKEDGDRDISFDLASDASRWIKPLDEAFPRAARIGLIVPTSIASIRCWQSILLSGRTPILLPYPTAGLSRLFWESEVEAAVSTLAIEGIIHGGALADPGLALRCIELSEVAGFAARPGEQGSEDGRALRLFSGTIGFGNGVDLAMADVARHVCDYNKLLDIGSADCVVSWFPLSHHAGLVASVLLPIMAGARVVMVDQVTWERRPQLLYELIEEHRATVCFMPNFGYEAMAKRARVGSLDLSSMRHWISCAGLMYPDTIRRFLDASRTAPEAFSNCYSVTRNIFAVSQSAGFRTLAIAGRELASCGSPIAPTSLKIIDGEIHVRSPYTSPAINRDKTAVSPDGYQATGDLGEMIAGELYVRGRKGDRLYHAGRTLLLTDLDQAIAEALPDHVGNICTFERYNEMLSGDQPVCLIEDDRFWVKNRDSALTSSIRQRLGTARAVERPRVQFVPPGFITKRLPGTPVRDRTRECYIKLEEFRRHGYSISRLDRRKVRQRIIDLFPELQPDIVFGRQIDSLGLANLSILLEDAGIELSSEEIAEFSLDTLPIDANPVVPPGTGPVLRVVCWLDFERVDYEEIQSMLTNLGRRLGVSVHCYFAVAPPAAAVLSDLVFEDYFMVRHGRFDIYNSVRTVLALLRDADVIITDDILQMLFPWSQSEPQAYPTISHRFENADLADFLAVRWSFYSEQHHLIATEPMLGRAQSPEMINRSLDDIEDYLGVPIVRVAFASQNRPYTAHWQVCCVDPRLDNFPLDRAAQQGVEGKPFTDKLFDVLLGMTAKLQLRPGEANDKWITPGQAHFCGALVNPALVDFVLERYDSFLVLGRPASIPYLSKQARRLGKKLMFRADLHCPPGDDYQCVLQTGSFGEPETDKPIFQLMDAGWTPQARNVPDEVLRLCPAWLWPEDLPTTPWFPASARERDSGTE